jgi:hypothetical protein
MRLQRMKHFPFLCALKCGFKANYRYRHAHIQHLLFLSVPLYQYFLKLCILETDRPMKIVHLLIVTCAFVMLNANNASAQKRTRWTDSLDYAAARGKQTVLCGDESYYTDADQPPFYKDGSKKVPFKELLQQKLDATPAIDGNASIVAEIIVNCKGVAGSLKLLKYSDKENPAEIALINAINQAISMLPDFSPAKNEGRVVNYKADKIKFKTANGKITFN